MVEIIIPKEMKRDLKAGDRLVVVERDNVLTLEKDEEVFDLALLSEESFAKTWMTDEEDEAWKDL